MNKNNYFDLLITIKNDFFKNDYSIFERKKIKILKKKK